MTPWVFVRIGVQTVLAWRTLRGPLPTLSTISCKFQEKSLGRGEFASAAGPWEFACVDSSAMTSAWRAPSPGAIRLYCHTCRAEFFAYRWRGGMWRPVLRCPLCGGARPLHRARILIGKEQVCLET